MIRTRYSCRPILGYVVGIFRVSRASCYDGSVLGSQGSELLHCDYGITQQWLLETATQPCWDTGSDYPKTLHPDDRQQFGFSTPLSTTDPSSASSHRIDNDSWSDKEKALLEKGLVKMYTTYYSDLLPQHEAFTF
jgi:hypothetical protein